MLVDGAEGSPVLPGGERWTVDSVGPPVIFKSHVDAAGRFFKVTVERISATNLEFTVKNEAGVTVMPRRMQINGAGTTVWIFGNAYGVHVDGETATPEFICCGLLDLSPESQTAHSNYVWGHSHRNNGDGASGSDVSYGSALKDGVAQHNNTTDGAGPVMSNDIGVGSVPLISGGGAYIFKPVDIMSRNGGLQRIMGRRFHQLFCTDQLAVGNEISVPIDDAVNATFKVLGITTTSNCRIAQKKGA